MGAVDSRNKEIEVAVKHPGKNEITVFILRTRGVEMPNFCQRGGPGSFELGLLGVTALDLASGQAVQEGDVTDSCWGEKKETEKHNDII